MRRSTLLVLSAIVGCLGCASIQAATALEPVIGAWELVGFGDVDGNLGDNAKIQIDIGASGHFDYQVVGESDTEPFRVSGKWTRTADLLRLSPDNCAALKITPMSFRVTWDGRTLVLSPVEEDSRDAVPLRFETRPPA